ncbi:MAG: acyl carrier protein [Oscillospiraceae bacterium]|nr:acyl carrier protein [Oscillospiraceae bacterium]
MFEQLKEIICNYVDVNPEDITMDAKFIEDLGFNSYDFMSMLGELEETLEIQVDEQEVIKLQTVEDALNYFETLKK